MDGKWKTRMVVVCANEDEASYVAKNLRANLREQNAGRRSSVPVAKRYIEVTITLTIGGNYARDTLSAGIWALTRLYDLWPGDKPVRPVTSKTTWVAE